MRRQVVGSLAPVSGVVRVQVEAGEQEVPSWRRQQRRPRKLTSQKPWKRSARLAEEQQAEMAARLQ
eukprot:m.72248 g.72248  ORF g.72248 m.72248 type:complete len:66 (-) comp14241_c0_seq1:131-328(-)